MFDFGKIYLKIDAHKKSKMMDHFAVGDANSTRMSS